MRSWNVVNLCIESNLISKRSLFKINSLPVVLATQLSQHYKLMQKMPKGPLSRNCQHTNVTQEIYRRI